MKILFCFCCLTVLVVYLGMGEFRNMAPIQTALGPMDMFLALAVPIGFSRSIILYRKEQPLPFKGTFYALGFLLVFTLSQVMHGMVGSVFFDTLTMAQEPPPEKMIARHIDQALFDPQAEERVKAAAILYLVSGVKTMYKSKEDQYEVFAPNQQEREERKQWKRSDAQVDAKKDEIFDQVIAITNRSTFHTASFFVLFSIILIVEVIKARITGQR